MRPAALGVLSYGKFGVLGGVLFVVVSISLCGLSFWLPSGGVVAPPAAFGQQPDPIDSSQFYLHIPSKMIAGNTYQRVAVSVAPAGFGGGLDTATAYLASGSPAVRLPESTLQIPFGRTMQSLTYWQSWRGMPRCTSRTTV